MTTAKSVQKNAAKTKPALKKTPSIETFEEANKQRGTTSAQQAYQYVIQGLEQGRLETGTRIRETELAERCV